MTRSKRESSSNEAATIVLFKVLYCRINFYIFLVFFCIICVKSIMNLLHISDCVSWVPKLILLDLTNILDL